MWVESTVQRCCSSHNKLEAELWCFVTDVFAYVTLSTDVLSVDAENTTSSGAATVQLLII